MCVLAATCACGEEAEVGRDRPSGLAWGAVRDVVGLVGLSRDTSGAFATLGSPPLGLPAGPALDQCAYKEDSGLGLLSGLSGLHRIGTREFGASVNLVSGSRTLILEHCAPGECSHGALYFNENLTAADYLAGQAYNLHAPNASGFSNIEAVLTAAPTFAVVAPATGARFVLGARSTRSCASTPRRVRSIYCSPSARRLRPAVPSLAFARSPATARSFWTAALSSQPPTAPAPPSCCGPYSRAFSKSYRSSAGRSARCVPKPRRLCLLPRHRLLLHPGR